MNIAVCIRVSEYNESCDHAVTSVSQLRYVQQQQRNTKERTTLQWLFVEKADGRAPYLGAPALKALQGAEWEIRVVDSVEGALPDTL